MFMAAQGTSKRHKLKQAKGSFAPFVALVALLLIGGYAVMGPTGALAWSDYQNQLAVRKAELASLEVKRDALKNRVRLLNPKAVDPDLATELIRKNLNVVHPDEVIVTLKRD